MGVWLNKSLIKETIRSAAREELNEIGDAIASDARRRAPIRKVFRERKGYRRRFRRLTAVEQAVATRLAQDYYTRIQPNELKRRRAIAHIRNYASVASPGRQSANRLSVSRRMRTLGFEQGRSFDGVGGARRLGGGIEPGAETKKKLTSRGLSEIRSGQAVHRESLSSGNVRVQAGGALKASIESEGARETANGARVTVTAAIRYAKYVEFPTIRTSAQPFLRPALYAIRESLPRRLSKAINRAFKE
jgi:HK97 gp10 family phage protein